MCIPKALAQKLLGLSQLILSNIEIGHNLDAKFAVLRMAAIISVETDRSDEIERYPVITSP